VIETKRWRTSTLEDLAGVKVSASGGDNSYVTATDSFGRARIKDLQPGEYRVTSELTGYSTVSRILRVPAKGCAEFWQVMGSQ
jgi:hypothetical protein